MNIQPIADRVVVKPIEREELTKSGIIIPDSIDKERPEQGEVIAVGIGRLLDSGARAEMEAKVGDKILFKKYAPDEVKIEKQTYLIVSEMDIVAILK